MKHRVLVIGMDSSPLSLLVPWISKGYLPNLARIFDRGSYGDLYSRIPVTPIAWSSIYTGKNPGKHGILGFRNHKPNSYSEVGVNSTIRDGRDVWEIIGSYGKKVVVVNTPLTYPPRPVNGFLVCGFMAPGTEYDFTYPEELGAEIKKIIPKYRIGTAPSYIKTLYLRELNSTVKMVGDASLYLLNRIDWDFGFVVFKETDEVQHAFYDKPEGMISLYQNVDGFVGKFMELAGENSHVIIVSDHGGERVDKRFNVAEFLQMSQLLKVKPQAPDPKSTSLFRLVAKTMFGMRLQWILDIPGSRKVLAQLMKHRANSPKAEGDDGFFAGAIDWGNTTAFIQSGIGLRINLKGREPYGIVEQSDYEKIREQVARQLAGIKDPDNGNYVFKYALPREQVLSGPHIEQAPDILCLPNTGYLPTESLTSFDPLAFAASHKSLFSRSTLWSGTHTEKGVVAISGRGISKSKIIDANLDDIAPTILYAMGMPIPRDVDGRVMTEAFTPEFRNANPIQWESEEAVIEQAPRTLSEEEESKIEERLKALGYLS
ncbi:MAG TPA: alkaline phosphatase family protein [Nitrososphaerales archaeon]|nr:alkaline phosphatase family protein [Nitrososphaerales archaeon]